MGRLIWVVIVFLGIIKLLKCEQYPEFFSEAQLMDTFGMGGFNREHPYRPRKKPPQVGIINYSGSPGPLPIDMVAPTSPEEKNLNLPRPSPWLGYKGPGRQGPTVRPEERIFPDFVWPPRDDSSKDMNELPLRLSQTDKWAEFLALVHEESKKHPKGEVMPNWEQDIEKWAGYSRQLLVRDKYEKDKALRARQEKEKNETPVPVTLPPKPQKPQPGMEMYWSGDTVFQSQPATNKPPQAPKGPQPQIFITPNPIYTYNRPAGSRRHIPGVGEPGFPVDEDPTYAGEENPRKYGAMPGFKYNPGGGGYIGDKPTLRAGAAAYADYSQDYPGGHASGINFVIPGEQENKAMQVPGPGALRSGPSGGAAPPPGYGPPGYGGPKSPPGYGGQGGPPRYGRPGGQPSYGGPQGPPGYGRPGGNAGWGGPPRPPPYRGPPGLGGQPGYNPGRMALRGGGQAEYLKNEKESMLRMAETILEQDDPSSAKDMISSGERVKTFEEIYERKRSKMIANGQLKA